MKTLKFASKLVPLILEGKKTTTWRLFDDKNIEAGDELSFLEFGIEKEFARAKVLYVRKKKLGEVTPEDFTEGHEAYASREEMFEVFRSYYGDRASESADLKIIKFKLG